MLITIKKGYKTCVTTYNYYVRKKDNVLKGWLIVCNK